jgi:hypothetical protein
VIITLIEEGHELFLNVYDSSGRHVGLNESLLFESREEIDLQIPGASYFNFHNGTSEILLPANVTSLKVEVGGAYMKEAQEPFSVSCTAFLNGTLASSKTVTGSMAKGSAADTSVTFQGGVLTAADFAVTTPTVSLTSSSGSGPIQLPGTSLMIVGAIVLVVVLVVFSLAMRRRGHGTRESQQVVEPEPKAERTPEPSPPSQTTSPPPPSTPYQAPRAEAQEPLYRFCTNCGSVVVKGQTFCTNCGADVR